MEDEVINGLARNDENDVIKRLQEISLEYLALTPEAMVTGLPSTITLSRPKNEWGELENINIEKMRNTLASAVLSLRKKVHIRYLARSEPAFRLAEGVNVDVQNDG